jgi:molybdate/tungstate transport system permease protein
MFPLPVHAKDVFGKVFFMSRRSPGPLFPLAGGLLLLAIAGPTVALLLAVPPSAALAAFAAEGAREALRVSLIASSCATIVAGLLGIPAGYWLAHRAPAWRAAALFVLALPLAFPPVASGIILLHVAGTRSAVGGWLAAHGFPLVDSLAGVALAEFFVAGSFVAIAACAAFGALDPLPEEAARTLGASEWRIFARIALPAAAGNVLAGVAFAWLRAIGEYGATSILAYHPTSMPVAVYVALSAQGVAPALALCYGFVVLAALVLVLQWVLRKRVV